MTEKKPKILIGGGAGYIGTALVPELIKDGYNVEVIDLLWFGNYLPKKVKVIEKDLLDLTVKDFKGVDVFIFLAGLSTDSMAEHSPSKNFIMNGALPAYLAYLAKVAGVKRFIYASSSSIYGNTKGKFFTEADSTVSKYPYAISKLQGENGVMNLADENFSVISLRQGTVSGYSPRMRMDLVVNAMFKTAMLENKIVVNNPKIWRPLYGMQDCIMAYCKVLDLPFSISGVFNVASQNYQVGEIGEKVKNKIKSLTNKEISIEVKYFADDRDYAMDFTKATKELLFSPKQKVEDIVEELFMHKNEIGDLNNDQYYNIRIFEKIVQKEEMHKRVIAEMDKFKY